MNEVDAIVKEIGTRGDELDLLKVESNHKYLMFYCGSLLFGSTV